jgi:hypothetical protein
MCNLIQLFSYIYFVITVFMRRQDLYYQDSADKVKKQQMRIAIIANISNFKNTQSNNILFQRAFDDLFN